MVIFKPKLGSSLWERKCMRSFDSEYDMRRFVARQATISRRYIGQDVYYAPEDIELSHPHVLVDGMIVGYVYKE